MNRWTELVLGYLEERRGGGDRAAGALLARRDCPREAPKKKLPAQASFHKKARRAEEREREEVSATAWSACIERTVTEHRGRCACEACHKVASANHMDPSRGLEPHHLELGAGGRRDAPEVVMALCAGCHRLDPRSAHRAPRAFVQTVVIPWLDRHGYPLPNRKEYRA